MKDFDDMWMILDECGFKPIQVISKKFYGNGQSDIEIVVNNKLNEMQDEIDYIVKIFNQDYDNVRLVEWKF